MDEPQNTQEDKAISLGPQIGKIAFTGIIAIPAIVISSVGCGTLIGSLIGSAIAGNSAPKGPTPASVNVSLVVALAITVLFALGLTSLILSNVKFAAEEGRNKTVRQCLTVEQVVLTAILITVMALGGMASLANPNTASGPPALAGPSPAKKPN